MMKHQVEEPSFFDTTPIRVGQDVAILYGGWEWAITQVIGVDDKRQRICCKAVRTEAPAHFWYDKTGNVLSEKTGRPLKGTWKAGHLYPLTDEVCADMRLSAKQRQLSFMMSHRVHWAIESDWHGHIDENRLDFVLDRFEQALADLPQVVGTNGQEHHYQRQLQLPEASLRCSRSLAEGQ